MLERAVGYLALKLAHSNFHAPHNQVGALERSVDVLTSRSPSRPSSPLQIGALTGAAGGGVAEGAAAEGASEYRVRRALACPTGGAGPHMYIHMHIQMHMNV